MTGLEVPDLEDALVAGARCRAQGRSDGRDPYPSAQQIAAFQRGVRAMLEELDGSLSVSDLREILEDVS